MYRRFAASIALIVFSLAPFVGGGTASAASSWVGTSTRAFILSNATDLGPVQAGKVLRVDVALALRNNSQLRSYILATSTPGNSMFGQHLTPAQFASQYGPTSSQIQSVESYLSGKGLTKISATPNGIYVSATGTAAQIETAFNTHLESYSQHGLTVYANTAPAMVPSSLHGVVISVLGLNNASRMHLPTMRTAATPPTAPDPNGLTDHWAPSFQKAYGAKGTMTGYKTPIAIFAEGNVSQVVTDLRKYEADSHNTVAVSSVPVTVEHVGVSSPDTAGLVEWDMDTQTSTGIAGAVQRLYIYDTTSLTDSDVALEFSKFATQDLAKAGSASFGECEFSPYLDGMMVANDEVMAEAAAQGQTVFASAGDDGGFCPVEGLSNGVPAGLPDVLYPASSPYVVSAGGTTLFTNPDGTYNDETAWVAGGGGPSLFEYQPAWQSGVAPPTADSCLTAVACLGKDLPDVAMDADFLNSPADFYNNGAPTTNGGTSLASPLSLGSWARVESYHSNTVGFAAPSLYGDAGTSAFHDVQLGDTGPYPATPGWDYATGNGSFNIAQMDKLIVKPVTPIAHFPVPSPACNLFYDASGDANPLGSTGNVDSLDLLSGGLSTSSDGKTLTAVLRVKSLNDGPGGTTAIAGAGDKWYFLFGYMGTTYFLTSTYAPPNADPTNPAGFTFGYGHIEKTAAGSNLYHNDGTATGSVNTVKGLININAPLSVLGPQLTPPAKAPIVGSVVTNPTGQTYELIGAGAVGGSLQPADAAGSATSYTAGKTC